MSAKTEESVPQASRSVARQFLSFVAIGFGNFLFNLATYTGLVYLGVHYLIASGVGWAGGVVGGYFLNRRYTFAGSNNRLGEIGRYWLIYILQLIVSWSGLVVLIEWAALDPFVAYAINVVVVTAVSFIGVRWFVFGSSNNRKEQDEIARRRCPDVPK